MEAIDLYNEGLIKATEGALDEAIKLLERSLRKDPLHVNTYNVLGKLLIRKGALRKARWYWKRALTIDPLNRTALACLEASKGGLSRIGWPLAFSLLLIGSIFAFRGAEQQIQTLHRELSTIGSRLEQGVFSPSRWTSPSAKQVPTEDSSQIKPLDKGKIKEVYSLALQYHKNGDFERAIPKFEEILAYPYPHDLKDNAQYWIGESHYDQGDYKRALREYKKIKALYPRGNKVLDAQIKIAYCYYKLGEDGKALALLRELADNPPKEPHAERAIQNLMRRIHSKLRNRQSP